MTIKNHFHINGFALNLALKVRLFGTRKWPVELFGITVDDRLSVLMNTSLIYVKR